MSTTAKKRIAHKIELWFDQAGGTNFTKLCNVKKVNSPGASRDAVELICMDDDVEQSCPAPLLKLGDMSLQVYWDDADADHQLFERLIIDQPAPVADPTDYPSFQLRFPFVTPITQTWHGWLKDFPGAEYEVKAEVMRDAVVHVNTTPVRA